MNKIDIESSRRLREVIEWSGKSTHAFAMYIGLKRSETLYRIIKNKNKLSIRLVGLIIEKCPELNRSWLMYNEGEMLVSEDDIFNIHNMIPFYHNYNNEISHHNIYVPDFKHCDIAVVMNDKSFEPEIAIGSTLILKKSELDIIIWGQLYYIVTFNNIAMTRIANKSEKSDSVIILRTNNNKKYERIEIAKKDIKDIYIVCGVISKLF